MSLIKSGSLRQKKSVLGSLIDALSLLGVVQGFAHVLETFSEWAPGPLLLWEGFRFWGGVVRAAVPHGGNSTC